MSVYMAARAGVETMTLRTKGVDSTNAPPCPANEYLMVTDKSVRKTKFHQTVY